MTGRLVVLASGTGTNLQAIMDACTTNVLAADVVAVISNNCDARALQRARNAGIEAVCLEKEQGEPRRDYDTRLAAQVSQFSPDYVVLAGWMLLLSANFLDHVGCPVINLHPALPGELPGINSIERAHSEAIRGERARSGVMVHFVPDEGVDNGPVLATVEIPVSAQDSLEDFTKRVHEAEHKLLVDALIQLCN